MADVHKQFKSGSPLHCEYACRQLTVKALMLQCFEHKNELQKPSYSIWEFREGLSPWELIFFFCFTL